MESIDASGNSVVQMEYIGADETGESFKRLEIAYDEANRKIAQETFLVKGATLSGLGGVKTSAGDRTEYSYDKAGKLVKQTGPAGRENIQSYDSAGNIIAKLVKVEDGNYDVQRFEYDFRSRVIKKSLLVKTSDLNPDSLAGAEFSSLN